MLELQKLTYMYIIIIIIIHATKGMLELQASTAKGMLAFSFRAHNSSLEGATCTKL